MSEMCWEGDALRIPYVIWVSFSPWWCMSCRQLYLKQCGEVMAAVGRRWRLRTAMAEWRAAAIRLQEAHGNEARQAVMLRSAFK